MVNIWRCDCGKMEYGKLPPTECDECWKTNSFIEVPADMAEEMEEDSVLGTIRKDYGEDDD